jgi:hypothetical protein
MGVSLTPSVTETSKRRTTPRQGTAQIRSAGIAVSDGFRICTATTVSVNYAFICHHPNGWWQSSFVISRMYIVRSHPVLHTLPWEWWQSSATMYLFLSVVHPCGGSAATARAVVVTRGAHLTCSSILYNPFASCAGPPGTLRRFASASRS